MSDRSEITLQADLQRIINELAKRDASLSNMQAGDADDSTIRELKAELDTLVSELQGPPPVDSFADESDCRRATELVEALGLEPTVGDGADADTAPAEREPLGELGQYQLLAKLGQGGMGTVYKALHNRLDKIVALKVLPEQRTSDAHAVSRFEREMRAVGKLEHANIVRAMDANEHEGTHYLVMEYVAGIDLSELVQRIGPLPIADACELIRQAAIGLQHAHEHGLVHRDIKPSNMMLTVTSAAKSRAGVHNSATVKILDLGLSRLEDGDRHELTATGQIMGTIDYMAPEQTGDSREVDIRADIYGLGATLFKLLCGRAPYADERYDTVIKKLNALATQPVPSIRARRKEAPEQLVDVVSKMLAKQPGQRYATPHEVAEVLEPFAGGSDLTSLLHQATAIVEEPAADQSAAGTQDSLKSGSVETDPTIDMSAKARIPASEMHGESRTASPGSNSGEPSEVESTVTATPPAANAGGSPESPPPTANAVGSPESTRASAGLGKGRINRHRRKRNRIIIRAVTLVGVVALVAAFVVISIQTDKGTIKVVSHDPNVEVTIRRNGEVVDGFQVKQRQDATSYYSGEYEIEIKGGKPDGVSIKNEHFKLTRGKEVLVEISRVVAGNHQLEQGSNKVAASSHPTRWQPGPADNVLPGLIPRPAKFDGIKRWQIETKLPRGMIHTASFSPNGNLLACGTDTGQVRIYDAESMQLVELLPFYSKQVRSVAWSPDGQCLAFCGDEPALHLWHAKDKQTSIIELDKVAESLSWAPDSKRLAVTQSFAHDMEVWTVAGEREVSLPESHLHAVAWSPDGRWLAGGTGEGKLRLWNTKDFSAGPVVETDEQIHTIAWRHDSERLATGHESNQIRIWKTDGTLDKVLEARSSQGPVYSIAWHPLGNKLVSCSVGFKVHDLDDDSKSFISKSNGLAFDVCWHPDGKSFACVDQQERIQFYRPDGVLLKAATGHPGFAAHLEWSHEGEILATSDHWVPQVRLWDRHGVSEKKKDELVRDACLAWHPREQEIAIEAPGGGFQIWDTQTEAATEMIPALDNPASVAWSPDGKFLAMGHYHDGTTEIRDRSGKLVVTLKEHKSPKVKCIAWSPDGKTIVSGSDDRTARLWSPDGTPGPVMQQPNQCREVAWNPSSDRIAVVSGTTIIWNLDGTRGPELQALRAVRGPDHSVDWSPDGKQLVTGSHDRAVRLWSDRGLLQATMNEHDAPLFCVDWSPTGKLIASGADDSSVIVWDAQTTEPVWVGVQLGTGDSATFSAAGQVVDGDADVIDEHFVYVVESEDGTRELLKPSEFQARIGRWNVRFTTDPDRRAAEWVLENQDWGTIRRGSLPEERIEVGKPLPEEPCVLERAILRKPANVTDDDLKRLAELSDLRQLSLYDIAISDEGIRNISRSKTIDWLDFTNCPLSDDVLRQIVKMKQLTNLGIADTKTTGAAIEILANLPKLESLRVSENALKPGGLTKLAQLKALEKLGIVNSPTVTDDDILQVAKLKSLTELTLTRVPITDAALEHLRSMSNLTFLQLKDTRVTSTAVQKLSKLLPHCQIVYGPHGNLTTVGPVAAASPAGRAELIAAGDAAFGKGDLDGALDAYSQAIGKDPENAEGYRGRGWVYLNRDDYAKALDDFNQAIRLDANNGLALNGRGWVYIHLGKLDQALNDLNQATRLMPESAYARHSRGVVHFQLKKYDEAIGDLTEAIRLDANDAWSYLYRSKAHQAKGDKQQADADQKKAVELDPSLSGK